MDGIFDSINTKNSSYTLGVDFLSICRIIRSTEFFELLEWILRVVNGDFHKHGFFLLEML